MNKKLIKFTLWFLGIISLLIIVSILLVYVNREKIKGVIISELNKQLLTEIKVSAIDIEFFSTFPQTSLSLEDVIAFDALPNSNDTLFYFKKLYLSFNIWDILRENYDIKAIKANDGCFNMRVNSSAEVNYEFWKKSESESESNFSLSLKKISLNNIRYSYRNECTKQYYEIVLRSTIAKGDFTSNQQEIRFRSKSLIKTMQVDNLLLLSNREMDIGIDFANNTLSKTMKVKEGELIIDGLRFDLSGSLNYGDSTLISLLVKGKDINLKDIISLMPEEYSKKFKDFKSDGDLVFNFQMQGPIDKTHMPSLSADFILNNGELINKKLGIRFSKINLKGSFSNGSNRNSQTSFIKLDNFSLLLNQGSIKGYARLSNFSNLNLDASIKANLPLGAIYKFIQLEEIKELSGDLDIDFKLKGDIRSLEKIKDRGLSEIIMSGRGSVKSLNYSDQRLAYPITNLSSDFLFNNTTIDIEKLSGSIGQTSILFEGSVGKILPYIFNQSNKFSIIGNLKLGRLNINDWLKKEGTKLEDKSPSNKFILPDFFDANINIEIDKLIYKKSVLSDFKSNIRFINNNLVLEGLSFNACGGWVRGKLSLLTNNKKKIIGDLDINKIDISSFLYTMDNFGQNSLTNKNIEGDITAKLNLSAELDSHYNILSDKLIVGLKYKINEGKLIGVPLMKKLSYFVDESELETICFQKIESSLTINNSCLSMDEVMIKSNAINFSFLGKHYFNKNIDYRAEIKLSEFASKKKKAKLEKTEREFGEIHQDEASRTSLFVKITGTTDNPIFAYDTEKSIEIIKDKLKTDKKIITSSIDKDLNLGVKEMKKDKADFRCQERGGYLIEWGDDRRDTVPDTVYNKETKFDIEW